MSDIRVTLGADKTFDCPFGVIADTLLPHFGIAESTIIALRVNNEIRP